MPKFQGLGFRVSDFGFRVQGLGVRVSGFSHPQKPDIARSLELDDRR